MISADTSERVRVIDAALCGYEYSGLPKLLSVADHPRFKAARSPMRALRETSVSVLFDGGNQSGMLEMYYATRAVIEESEPAHRWRSRKWTLARSSSSALSPPRVPRIAFAALPAH